MKKAKRGFVKFTGILALAFSAGAIISACSTPSQESTPSTTPVSTEKVVWTGVDDIAIEMGEEAPDLLAGVRATQGNKVLTVRVDSDRSDEVDTGLAGAFSIYYVAYDGDKAISEDLDGEYIRTLTVSRGVFIDNANFETADKKGWNGNGNGNSAMTWDIDTQQKALVVDITKSGDEYWQNQVEFGGLEVKANTTYVINIRAKSSAPRNIGASLEVPSLGYKCIDEVSVNSVGYTMTSEFADYKFYYTADADYTGVKFGIILGRFNQLDEVAAGEHQIVTIDSVAISKASKKANSTGIVFTGNREEVVHSLAGYQALAPVTAVDANGAAVTLVKEGAVQSVEFNDALGTAVFGEMFKYIDAEGNLSYFRRQIKYEAARPERAHEYDTLDGDFNDGLKWWNPEENNIVAISANAQDHTIGISSVKAAPSNEADWRGQLQQNNNGGKLTKGHGYKMVVEAKIDNIDVTTLRLEFCAGAGNPNAKKEMVFTAADTYQTFTSETFQPNVDVEGGNYRVGLLIGEYSQAYHLTVKSIHVVEDLDVEPLIEREHVYDTLDGDFTAGLKYWTTEGANHATCEAIKDGNLDAVKITSVAPADDRADWRAQLQQNNNGGKLEAGHSYKAVVNAKISNIAVTTLRLEFCAGANNPNPKADLVFAAADTYQEISTAVFTPSEDVTAGNFRVGLLLADYEGSYVLTVDSIQVVEVVPNA